MERHAPRGAITPAGASHFGAILGFRGNVEFRDNLKGVYEQSFSPIGPHDTDHPGHCDRVGSSRSVKAT